MAASQWQLGEEIRHSIKLAAESLVYDLSVKRPTEDDYTMMRAHLEHAVCCYLDQQEERDEYLRARAAGEDC